MDNNHQQIESFFNRYADAFNQAINGERSDVEETASFFADSIIAVNPDGFNCGKNDEQLRKMILQGYAFYRNIGIISMEIISKQITALDDYHTLTKVHWKSRFIKKDNTKVNIEFDVIYLIQTKSNDHKIFAYITSDEQKALKENGLID